MNILILGFGRMGRWFAREFSGTHKLALIDPKVNGEQIPSNIQLLQTGDEIAEFSPELVLNAASLTSIIDAFEQAVPFLERGCILADIASIKGELQNYYIQKGFPYVSLHPMFGPTFAKMARLEGEYAIIIKESDNKAASFFKDFFTRYSIRILSCHFYEHDALMAYSLALPFSLTLAFTSIVHSRKYPGTTFAKHLETARGLLKEDPELIYEVLHTPHALEVLKRIEQKLNSLIRMLQRQPRKDFLDFLSALNNKPKEHYLLHLDHEPELTEEIFLLLAQSEKENS